MVSWDGLNLSPSLTASLSLTRTPTGTPSSTPPSTVTRTSGSTASRTVTPTGSQYCKPENYVAFYDHDLVGSRVGGVTFTASERQCQVLCCDTAACEGYAYDALDLLRGTGTAACWTLTNVTERIPSNGRVCGVQQRVLSS